MQIPPRTRRTSRGSAFSGDRQTTWRLRSSLRGGELRLSRYNHMLNEDISHRIVPYKNRSEGGRLPLVRLSSPNDIIESNISVALSRNEYHRNSLEEAVCDFVRKCAARIMRERKSIYEIVRYTATREPTSSFSKLEHVPSENIRFLFWQPFQLITISDGREQNEPIIRRISKNKLVIFTMPQPYRTGHKTLQLQLDAIGKDRAQALHLKAMEETDRKTRNSLISKMDIVHSYRLSHLAVLSATNLIGWNARDTHSEYLQEYYILVRFFRFERFKLRLRESILASINNTLRYIIADPAYNGKIEFQGLPTEADIQQAEFELGNGTRPFKDIIGPFLRY